jgi:hypothetical protein
MAGSFTNRFIQKVYRKISSTPLSSFALLLGFAVLLGFFFQPHLQAAILGSWGREQRFTQFLSRTQQGKNINPATFWEFRELYSPGNFTFDAGVEHLGTQVIQEIPESGTPLHTFRGPKIVSKDYLVSLDSSQEREEIFAEFLRQQGFVHNVGNELYSTATERIFEVHDGKRVIAFAKPLDEIMKVDGLFDFTEAERERLENHFWINITVLE